jgi:drug/metabolite transporter (DMT)-like permease
MLGQAAPPTAPHFSANHLMPFDAFCLALAAAFLHALWNVLIAGRSDVQAATAAALVVAVVAFLPVALARWRVEGAAIPFIIASAALELVYFSLLAIAYQRAELSLVYPLTRGLAPVLVLLGSVVLLGLGTSPGEVAGVLVVGVGIVVVRGLRGRIDWITLGLTLVIAASIAAYTLVDRYGVRHANPLPYLELVLVVPTVAYAAFIGRRRVRTALTPRTAAAGLAMFGAYALVLAALRLASAASVAAVRESSIVIAVALAAAMLREPVGARRYAGAVLVAFGVVLIALS